MISRAARASRIRLARRVSITQRSAVLGFRALPRRDVFDQRRRFASDSDPPPQFNAETEALISDKLFGRDAKRTIVKEDDNPKTPKDVDEDDADWDEPAFDEAGNSIAAEIDKFLADVAGVPTGPSQDPKPWSKPRRDRDTSTNSAYEQRSSDSASPRSKPRSVFSSDSMSELPVLPDFEPPSFQSNNRLRHNLLHNQPLGVSALGVPADAIIIKNPNKMRIDRKAAKEIIEKPMFPTADVDWKRLDPTNGANELDSKDEIWSNINELRPDSRALRMRDFEKLSRALFNGFTTDQLREYVRDYEMEAGLGDMPLGNYPWIMKQMPWTPFKSLPVAEKAAYKYSFVQKLIVQKWKVGIQEHVDALGQAFIWVDPHYFKFLALGSRPFLKGARNDFLDESNNEKLSTTSTECRLNITARKAATYAILERLDQHLKNVHHRMLPISQLTKHIPSPEELDDLARITSTSLKLHKQGKDTELQVSWFSEKKFRDSTSQVQNEDNVDTVLRLLTTLPSRGLVEKVACIPSLEPSSGVSGIFVGFNRERRSMAWRDKLRKWLRYVAPVGITNDTSKTPLDLAKTVSLPEYTGKLSSNFTTATFGHLLHSEAHRSTAKLSRKRRLLSPVTPHPASFSALKPSDDDPLSQSTAIILKFAPNVDRVTSPESKGPPVRLYIPITPETNIVDFKIPEDAALQCTVPWHVDDVMLPAQSVDVRLVNERHLPLDINQPELQKFLNIAHFNLRDGRLQTPKEVTLSIPEPWLSSRSKGGKASETSVDVLYAFRGIEIHQNIEMPLNGHTLRYSLIEAGQHGGKRQELTLQAGRPGAPATAFQGEQRESFLQVVEDVATGKFFSWGEGHKSVKAQQFDDFSYDLPAEELGEDFVVSEFDPEEEKRVWAQRKAYKAAREKQIKEERAAAKAAKKAAKSEDLKLDEKPTEESTAEPVAISETPAEQSAETSTVESTDEPLEKSTEEPLEKAAEEPLEKLTEESTEEPLEQPTEKPAELATEEPAKEYVKEHVEEPVKEPVKPAKREAPKPKAPAAPAMDENAFFRQFSSRAGDQLDQFKAPTKRRQSKKGKRAWAEDDLDEDDPFRIVPKPKSKLSSQPKNSSPSAGNIASKAGIAKQSPSTTAERFTFDDEWDDDFNDDEIEDNELSTAEIEAELVKMFGLDKPAAQQKARAVEEWEELKSEADEPAQPSKETSPQDNAQAVQQAESATPENESASPEKSAQVSSVEQSTTKISESVDDTIDKNNK
ncbi:hypothetical protein G7Z17_g9577 [Cylindrodendrum hubeiense]|uniref:Uncharacterized protein n=1 Tax=Cylindrodendrum hubeiense TaxID=595255 RepID=A0A9P5H187_9HYPO|nr:hypothetical protein G7Z17_g9577 [Cylindrodendrum hubeiense]